MTNIFNEAFNLVLGFEGGFQDLYNDRGNWTTGIIGKGQRKGTKYGITAMSYPHLDIKNLTLDDARKIYKENYWDRINGDKLEPALALVAFDTAINSGVGRAIEFLNKTDDVKTFLDLRRKFLKGLKLYNTVISGNRNRKTYGMVWDERVNTLEQQAAHWALVYPKNASPASPQPPQSTSNNFVVYNRGSKEIIISERYEDDDIIINPMTNKVYVTLKR